jgi:YXWGXW repeat-containing protein
MRSQALVRAAVVVFTGMYLMPAASQAGVLVSITVAPPVLPVYVQPIYPGDGFLWTPGYWAYGEAGYFWVPGVWMQPPSVGLLWTPGYWGWHGGLYAWNAGYWGPHVGFYGGVNYGFGYGGVGFFGGRWEGGHFAYNSAVAHVGVGFHSYHEGVAVNNVHTSFNGGAGGLSSRPSAGERSAMGEHHVGPTASQNSHHEMASHDRSNFASENHGRPSNAAMSRAHSPSGGSANHGGGENHGASANHTGGANHGASANHGSSSSAKAVEHKSGGEHNNSGGASKSGGSKPSGGGSKGGGGSASHASHSGGKK